MHVLIKRKLEGPSVPELGQPTSINFDSVTVPLNRPTTGPSALAAYELQRSLTARPGRRSPRGRAFLAARPRSTWTAGAPR